MIIFSWCTRKPPKLYCDVPIPPLRKDEWHSITIVPYLMDHYYGDGVSEEAEEVQYFTEHDLNGKIVSISLFLD